MKKFQLLLIVAVLAMMVSCNKEEKTAEAQSPEQKEAIDQALPADMQTLRIGHTLALYGFENESPEALIEAANLLASVQTAGMDAPVERGGNPAEAEKEVRSFKPADLLAAARQLAGDDATLLAMIQKTEEKIAAMASAEGERGSSCAVKTQYETVNASGFDSYNVEFNANELAACIVIGDGSTDLDLYIYDEDGNLVEDDTEVGDDCYCCWMPKKTAVYTIKIVNQGQMANDYVITIN